jgi:anthranilate synthase component 1
MNTKIHCRSYMADFLTPVSVYRRLSRESEHSFLLESVEHGAQVGRFSFIGTNPAELFTGSFQDFAESFQTDDEPAEDLPPFTGGMVGAIPYETVSEFEKLPFNVTPQASLLFGNYRTVVAFDHATQKVTIISRDGTAEINRVEKLLHTPLDQILIEPLRTPEEISIESNFRKEEFENAVLKARDYIHAGDAFQVVLSQRFQTDYTGDPFKIYRALRLINPSPYMFYLQFNDLSIVGSSPEMLVRSDGNRLDYTPIAGTRPRGDDEKHEAQLEKELLADEKERAEHLMLVDLGRNDLGRVCEYGSVIVDKYMQVEKFSHVMHITSRLKGRLKQGLTSFDAFRACFPAGTVSGAPKVRAMEIIDELEPDHRGFYAGGIGYFDYTGAMDTCIGIRTLVVRHGKASWNAGAGIVFDSIPEKEFEECLNKGKALRTAVSMANQMES